MTSSDGMAEGAAQCGGLIGLVFMALSAVSFSIMSLLVHVLARSHGIPSFEAVTARALVGACMAVLWARHAGAPLLPESDGTKRLLAVSFGYLTNGIAVHWAKPIGIAIDNKSSCLLFHIGAQIFNNFIDRVFIAFIEENKKS